MERGARSPDRARGELVPPAPPPVLRP
jgi:hypothetical protein